MSCFLFCFFALSRDIVRGGRRPNIHYPQWMAENGQSRQNIGIFCHLISISEALLRKNIVIVTSVEAAHKLRPHLSLMSFRRYDLTMQCCQTDTMKNSSHFKKSSLFISRIRVGCIVLFLIHKKPESMVELRSLFCV